MHGVREELLEAQAAALGLPLTKVEIPAPCPPELYAEKMRSAMEAAKAQDIRHVIFGDLYLEGIREYRETQLASVGMEAVFPLWGRDTRELAGEMIEAGVRTVLTCIDPKVLPASFSGRQWNTELLEKLPEGVDPCGEKGEFHSFVHDGPMFSWAF